MGYMRHHAIVVTGWREEDVMAAHQKACELFGDQNFLGRISHITEITPEATNGYRSFMISPDGSKEWWVTSNRGDASRDLFINWLSSNEDIYCNYAEVQFADEEGDNKLLRSS